MAAIQKTRAAIVRGGGAALGAWALAACGQFGGAPATSAPRREVTLTHWVGLGATSLAFTTHKALLEEQAGQLLEQIGARVNLEFANTEKVITAAAGGSPPHTAVTPYWDGAVLFGPGITADVDEALKSVKEWPALRKDIFPGMLETLLWNGKLTAIPTDTNNRVMFYDKSALTKVGIPVPNPNWTRDEFTQLAVKAAAPPDRWGFAFNAYSLDYLIFLGAAGGKFLNAEHTKWQVDNEVGRDTLRYLYDLANARQVTPNPPAGEIMRTGEGKVAFDMTVNTRYTTYKQMGIDAGAAPIPAHRAKFTLGHGWSVAVLKNPDKDVQFAAARLAMWLNAPRFQVPFNVKSGGLPVSKATLEHKDYQDFLAQDPFVKVAASQMPTAYRIPTFPSGRKAEFELDAYIKKAFDKAISLNDALAEGQRAAQVVLDADRKASRS